MPPCALLLLTLAGAGVSATRVPIFVTTADGNEGFAMVMGLLPYADVHVVAGVSDANSTAAQELMKAGAEVRVVTQSPSPEVFRGCAWAFILAPLTADRLQVGQNLINAAAAAGVVYAALLSVIGDPTTAPLSLDAYFQLESHLASVWRSDRSVTLRTYFYQQNLLLWSRDVQETGRFRLPLSSTCFAPLYNADVASVVAELIRPARVAQGLPKLVNLTGPRVLSGEALAEAASRATGQRLSFEEVNRTEASHILENAAGLDASEAALLLDLIDLQTEAADCALWPSSWVEAITGHPATDVSQFFERNAGSFAVPATELQILKV